MVMNEWFTKDGTPIPVERRIPDIEVPPPTLNSMESVNFPQIRLELTVHNDLKQTRSSRPHWLTNLVHRLARPLRRLRDRIRR